MEDGDDLSSVGCAIQLGKRLRIVEEDIRIAVLYARRRPLVLGIEVALVVDLYVLEQGVARDILVVRFAEERGDDVGSDLVTA